MTPQQAKLYQYLLDRIDNPVSPTYEELAAALGLKSRSGPHTIIEALIKQGKVVRGGDRAARTIRAIPPNVLEGVPSALLITELERRGELPRGR